jgi:hypothetical protein
VAAAPVVVPTTKARDEYRVVAPDIARIAGRLDVKALPADVVAKLWLHGLVSEHELSDAQLETIATSGQWDWRDFSDAEVEDIASGRRSLQECIRRRQQGAKQQ